MTHQDTQTRDHDDDLKQAHKLLIRVTESATEHERQSAFNLLNKVLSRLPNGAHDVEFRYSDAHARIAEIERSYRLRESLAETIREQGERWATARSVMPPWLLAKIQKLMEIDEMPADEQAETILRKKEKQLDDHELANIARFCTQVLHNRLKARAKG